MQILHLSFFGLLQIEHLKVESFPLGRTNIDMYSVCIYMCPGSSSPPAQHSLSEEGDEQGKLGRKK